MFDFINDGMKKWESAKMMVESFKAIQEKESKEVESFRKSLKGLKDFDSYKISLIVSEFSWFTIVESIARAGIDITDFPNTSKDIYIQVYLEWLSVTYPEKFQRFLNIMVSVLEMESKRGNK